MHETTRAEIGRIRDEVHALRDVRDMTATRRIHEETQCQ
jgi:hypothetical protein